MAIAVDDPGTGDMFEKLLVATIGDAFKVGTSENLLIDEVAESYRKEINSIYREHGDALAGTKNDDSWHLARRVINAYIVAVGKNAKRTLIFTHLADVISIKSKADFTATNVQHAIKCILGRGVDSKKILEHFATAGRTASNKSQWSVNNNPDDVFMMQTMLSVLDEKMQKIRYTANAPYR